MPAFHIQLMRHKILRYRLRYIPNPSKFWTKADWLLVKISSAGRRKLLRSWIRMPRSHVGTQQIAPVLDARNYHGVYWKCRTPLVVEDWRPEREIDPMYVSFGWIWLLSKMQTWQDIHPSRRDVSIEHHGRNNPTRRQWRSTGIRTGTRQHWTRAHKINEWSRLHWCIIRWNRRTLYRNRRPGPISNQLRT